LLYDGPLLCGFNVAIKGLMGKSNDRMITFHGVFCLLSASVSLVFVVLYINLFLLTSFSKFLVS